MARTPLIQYDKFTFAAGVEKIFTVPFDVVSLAFQVTAGTVARNNVTGQGFVGWTVANGLPQGFDMRSLEGEKIFFTGTEGATMEISWITGVAS
jgi:hypothetical protein